jgi:hypothetical protein
MPQPGIPVPGTLSEIHRILHNLYKIAGKMVYMNKIHYPIFLLCILMLLGLLTSPVEATAVNWVPLTKGIDYTWLPYSQREAGKILVFRVSPHQTTLRFYYHPHQKQGINSWAEEIPGAVLVVNASFFDAAGRPVGLVRLGDDLLSQSIHRPDSGQLTVGDNLATISRLTSTKLSKTYTESIESFPLLISNRKIQSFEDTFTARERRTLVALDSHNNLLIVLTSSIELSLTETATWLANAPLDVITALNFDGGASSQVHIAKPGDFYRISQGYASIPVVLAVYPN